MASVRRVVEIVGGRTCVIAVVVVVVALVFV